jgi:hypothetical protein
MCRDPFDVFLYPKSPSFWMIYGTIGVLILFSYLTTGHPTIKDIIDYPSHLIKSKFLEQPIFWITIGVFFAFFGGIELNDWYQQRNWQRKSSHQRWYELMHSDKYFHLEAEEYYYGDISN